MLKFQNLLPKDVQERYDDPDVLWVCTRLELENILETLPDSFDTPFIFGQKVHVDGDDSLTAVITGHMWRGDQAKVECSWLHNGIAHNDWFESWRITAA